MSLETSFQLHEVILALLLFAGLIPMTLQHRRHGNRWFYSAYLMFTVAALLSVVESFAFPLAVNIFEHLSVLVASFLFWMTAYKSTYAVLDKDAEDVLRELEEVIPR